MSGPVRVLTGPPSWGGYLLLVVFAFFIAFLFYSPDSEAHYNFDPEQDRHYYQYSTYSPSNTPTGAVQNYFDETGKTNWNIYQGPTPNSTDSCTNSNYSGQWVVRVGVPPSYTCLAIKELHCDYEEESVEGFCQIRSDNCAAAKDTFFTWDIPVGSDSYGINVPADATEAPFNQWSGCSMRFSSATTHNNYLTATYVVLGDVHLDHDHALINKTTKQAIDDPVSNADDFANCVPPAVDTATGEPVEDWGQNNACSIPDPNPDPEPDPNEPLPTNEGNEGIEQRLDVLNDEVKDQGLTLDNIDTELTEQGTTLDGIRTDSERTANATEGILAEMQDDSVIGGGSCSSPPLCSGDPINCAILENDWREACSFENSMSGYDPESHLGPAETGRKETVDVDTEISGIASTSGWITNRSCPSIPPVTVMGASVEWSFEGICQAFQILSFLVLGFSSFVGYRIVAGVDI